MSYVPFTPASARKVLDAVVREQLSEAWQRGIDTAPVGVGALADEGAPLAFGAISLAADAYAAAVARRWRGLPATELEGETS